MAIPKKGARRISVDGHVYRWLIRRKATHCQWASYEIGRLNVAIESAEAVSGSTLWLLTDRPQPKHYGVAAAAPIPPSYNADWIRQCRQIDWRPDRPASPVLAVIRDGAVQTLHRPACSLSP
jgi:hypothetical protein